MWQRSCANCGRRLSLMALLSPFQNIRCDGCGAHNYRHFSAYRIGAVFAALWLLIVAIYWARPWLNSGAHIYLLIAGYAAINLAISWWAPLRIKGTSDHKARNMILYLGLFLITMIGVRYLRALS